MTTCAEVFVSLIDAINKENTALIKNTISPDVNMRMFVFNQRLHMMIITNFSNAIGKLLLIHS